MDHLANLISQRQSSPAPAPEETPHEEPKQAPSIQEEVKSSLLSMKREIEGLLRLLEGTTALSGLSPSSSPSSSDKPLGQAETVIEGVFTGEKMMGEDGSTYDVPQNYASKSKMVEGDMLKLTINNQGKFIYKQIGPTDRERIRGTLFYNKETDAWNIITSTGKSYKILTASVTFFKGKAGEEVIALIPQNSPSDWAAVEHIIK